jgi:serine/threonine-protein kinase RsbW
MNPFLLEPVRGDRDYLHLFLETLPPLMRRARRALELSVPLRIAARLENLSRIRRFVEERAVALDVDPDVIPDLLLAVDEATTNVVVHGYQGREGIVEIEVLREEDALVIRLRDEAESFDPTRVPPPDLASPMEDRVLGKMGIYLVRQVTDEMSHRTTLRRGNELTLVRRGVGRKG